MAPYWKTTKFWNKIKYSFLGVGIPAEAISFLYEASPKVKVVVGATTIVGIVAAHLIGIWMVDENQNGVADPFEDTNKK